MNKKLKQAVNTAVLNQHICKKCGEEMVSKFHCSACYKAECKHHIYILLDTKGNALRVGGTSDIDNRIQMYMNGKGTKSLSIQLEEWFADHDLDKILVADVELIIEGDKKKRDYLEARYIEDLSPIFCDRKPNPKISASSMEELDFAIENGEVEFEEYSKMEYYREKAKKKTIEWFADQQ